MEQRFGQQQQQQQRQSAALVAAVAQAQERALDDEIKKYDAVLKSSSNDNNNSKYDDEDSELDRLRQRRLEEMKRRHEKRRKCVDELGHGKYAELCEGQDSRDVAEEFFRVCKSSSMVVVHFYRSPSSQRICDIVHGHLDKLCSRHLETKFVRINVEDCDATSDSKTKGASFLVRKLGVVVIPTMVLVRDQKVVHHLRGFDELGNTENFTTNNLAYVLGKYNVLERTDEEMESSPSSMTTAGAVGIRIQRGKAVGTHGDYDFDDDELDDDY